MKNNDWITHIKNSPVAKLNPGLFPETIQPKKSKQPRRQSKIISFIDIQLHAWAVANNIQIEKEYRFCKERKYRFDWAIQQLKIAVEYNGGVFMETKSGHSNAKGATRDSDKLNLAQALGWKVLTFTALNYKNVIQELEKFNE